MVFNIVALRLCNNGTLSYGVVAGDRDPYPTETYLYDTPRRGVYTRGSTRPRFEEA